MELPRRGRKGPGLVMGEQGLCQLTWVVVWHALEGVGGSLHLGRLVYPMVGLRVSLGQGWMASHPRTFVNLIIPGQEKGHLFLPHCHLLITTVRTSELLWIVVTPGLNISFALYLVFIGGLP